MPGLAAVRIPFGRLSGQRFSVRPCRPQVERDTVESEIKLVSQRPQALKMPFADHIGIAIAHFQVITQSGHYRLYLR